MIVPSERTKERILLREGKRWGIVPMWLDVNGERRCLAAEEIPILVPGPGLSYVDKLVRDITSISNEYPFTRLLWTRKRKGERNFAARAEMKRELARKERDWRIADAQRALTDDMRSLHRITIPARSTP